VFVVTQSPGPNDSRDFTPPSAALKADAERERAVIDADRLMMQMVQTSISLIGFGFTINAFFNGVDSAAMDADQTARRTGLALLCTGLVFLALGIWNQARLRLSIRARHRAQSGADDARRYRGYSAAPSFLLAGMLFIVGLGALASILLRMTLA
jgi:inner membrane protein YidH